MAIDIDLNAAAWDAEVKGAMVPSPEFVKVTDVKVTEDLLPTWCVKKPLPITAYIIQQFEPETGTYSIKPAESWHKRELKPAESNVQQLTLDFTIELKRTYAPPESCQYCLGTGIYGYADQGYGIAVCISGACGRCPCGKGTFFSVVSHTPTSSSKKCGTCGFSYNVVGVGGAAPVCRTQKARGIAALKLQSAFARDGFVVIADERQLPIVNKLKGYFYRPCPVVPRHGFVESRVCNNKAELKSLWDEARTADPDAEIVAMNFIKAPCSAILVPESGALAIGPGHDGATSGTNSVMLPVTRHKSSKSSASYGLALPALRKAAGIGKKQHTYIELLARPEAALSNRSVAVQVRSGPPLKVSSQDYVPKSTKVETVITPTSDLLAWEELTAKLKGKKGVVAYSKGSTLASHAAVHCVAAKIPFLTSKKPEIGQTVVATTNEAKFDRAEFERGFYHAASIAIDIYPRSLETALGILHNATALSTSEHWSVLYGYMVGIVFKAGALACLGEARHCPDVSGIKHLDRSQIWHQYWGHSPEWLARRVARLVPTFLSTGYSQKSTNFGGIGGPPWSDCSLQTVLLYKFAVGDDPTAALAQVNKVINVCHNGGKLLTKFLEQSAFSHAAFVPTFFIANRIDVVWRVLNAPKPKKHLKPYVMRGAKLVLVGNPKPCGDGERVILEMKVPCKGGSAVITTPPVPWAEGEKVYTVLTRYLDEL